MSLSRNYKGGRDGDNLFCRREHERFVGGVRDMAAADMVAEEEDRVGNKMAFVQARCGGVLEGGSAMRESWDDMMLREFGGVGVGEDHIREVLRRREQDALQVELANKQAEELGREGMITKEQWDAIRKYYSPGGFCMRCQKVPKNGLEINHIICLTRGGSNRPGNIQPLCGDCSIDQLIDPIWPADYRPDKGAFAKSLEG